MTPTELLKPSDLLGLSLCPLQWSLNLTSIFTIKPHAAEALALLNPLCSRAKVRLQILHPEACRTMRTTTQTKKPCKKRRHTHTHTDYHGWRRNALNRTTCVYNYTHILLSRILIFYGVSLQREGPLQGCSQRGIAHIHSTSRAWFGKEASRGKHAPFRDLSLQTPEPFQINH